MTDVYARLKTLLVIVHDAAKLTINFKYVLENSRIGTYLHSGDKSPCYIEEKSAVTG